MARTTIAVLRAENEALRAELCALRASHHAPRPSRDVAVVYVENKPFFTAFTHSTAYKLMRAIRAKGFASKYVPVRA